MAKKGSRRRAFLRAVAGGATAGLAGLAGCLGGPGVKDGDGGAGTPTVTPWQGNWKGDSPQFQFDAAHSGHGTAPGPSGEVQEHFTLPREGSNVNRVRAPAVVDGVAYVTMGGRKEGTVFTELVALNVPTGTELWTKRLEGGGVSETPTMPVVAGGSVYFGTGDKMYAYDAGSGERRWAKKHSFEETTRPTVAQKRLLIEDNTNLYAIDTETGEQSWEFAPETVEYTVFVRSPSVADGTVYVSASHLEAVRVTDGLPLWKFETEARTMAAPTVGENAVYVGTEKGNVHAISRGGSKRYWKKHLSQHIDGVSQTMAISDGKLVVRSGPYSGLKTVNAEDGSIAWEKSMNVRGPPIASNGTVYARNSSNLVALDRDSGDEKWSFGKPTPESKPQVPVVSGNYAFYVRGDATLVCIEGG